MIYDFIKLSLFPSSLSPVHQKKPWDPTNNKLYRGFNWIEFKKVLRVGGFHASSGVDRCTPDGLDPDSHGIDHSSARPNPMPSGMEIIFNWFWDGRQEPTAILNHVIRQLHQNINALQRLLQQAESTQQEIVTNRQRSEETIHTLEAEARILAMKKDDTGACNSLAKLHLERMALNNFDSQLARHEQRIVETRRPLHLLELQYRQYEVGKSNLLGQLAEAKTLEQEFALVNEFDLTGAVAAWQQAEGTVAEATQNVLAQEKVYQDTSDFPLGNQPLRVDPEIIENQLNQLKTDVFQSQTPKKSDTSRHTQQMQ